MRREDASEERREGNVNTKSRMVVYHSAFFVAGGGWFI